MSLSPSATAGLGDHRLAKLTEGGDTELAPEERPMLLQSLESSDRFRRDTGIGNIFHRGKISYREIDVVDSLHILIDGSRISVHVDEISPLRHKRDGTFGYSLAHILAHNVSGIIADLTRRFRGQHGEQRCNLECEVVWVDEDQADDRTCAGS